ncbi:SGNH/GDSL hydrolase family protein [Microbacterium enclense]|uniref:Lysophospholipase L1 n=1 Tax=Microbacterium enclense TaxID=993073 RepID=A0A1G6HS69_9MICO|nr:SGNH/GDSL hydrolase family protein [Microbacterium enclense]KSU55523.1 GDSL family lipase [Microbacterium enclense]SDB97050.1 Lysophospholipase L1 [Microbacterium enclense]
MASVRYVAIGDSFTEGVGDEMPDGTVRGWADLAAQGWADASGEPIQYANLAIRGKLIRPIVEQQLEPALALKPTHLSFNGGGNDMLRPRADIDRIVADFDRVVRRCDEEGVQLIVLSGADPSAGLPLGRVVRARGDRLSRAVEERLARRPDVITAYNWFDRELAGAEFWSVDRLHMNARGHHRVAARVVESIGQTAPPEWWHLPAIPEVLTLKGSVYYREHVAPWVRRRLAGTSSGDGRAPKFDGGWVQVEPQT